MNLLKLLIETSGLNQAKFAEKVGRKPQHISRQIKSGGGMHTKMFFEYAEILGIDELKFDYKNTNVTLKFK
jgi:transcriptional regulator with XRE-family HTH domain